MTIDWGIVAAIAMPIITLFIGVWINRRLENRPVLITYYGHISSFQINPPNQNVTAVHTHTVVLRNAGRKSAANVRLHHRNLPDFSMYPTVAYTTENLPDGSTDIVIPTMVPGKQVTISYLYFPPVVYTDINRGIESDEGEATTIPVLLQRIYPKWFNVSAFILLMIGLITVGYLIFLGVRHYIWPLVFS